MATVRLATWIPCSSSSTINLLSLRGFEGCSAPIRVLRIAQTAVDENSPPAEVRCLAANPKYILLDEPFAGVDPIAVGDIRYLVAQLKEKEIGVLITDHNVRETLEIIDRAYILHDGKVLMSGTPEQVIENNDVRRVYLGDDFRV